MKSKNSIFKVLCKPIIFYKNLSIQIKAGGWFLICIILQKGIVAITTPIYTRLLSTYEYGNINVYYSWQDILSIFITLGLSSTVFARGIINNEENKDTYTSIMLTLMSIIACGEFIVYLFFHKFINNTIGMNTNYIGMIFVYTYFSCVIDFWCQKERVLYKYKKFVVVTLLITICKPIISIFTILVIKKNKAWIRIFCDTTITAIIGIILIWIIYKNGKKLYNKQIWRESLIFVIPLIPHYLSQRLLSQSDRIMISQMIGNSEAGIYSLAYSIGMLLMLFNSAIDSTMSPWIFRKLKEKEYEKIQIISSLLMKIMALLTIFFVLISPELVSFFGGKKYETAMYLVPVIVISSFFIYVYVQFIYIEYFVGETKYIAFATIISAVINIILNIIGINKFGYYAAAYTTLICYILYAIGHYCVMMKLCKSNLKIQKIYNGKEILKISILVIGVGFILISIYEYTVFRFVITICVILNIVYKVFSTVNKYDNTRKNRSEKSN